MEDFSRVGDFEQATENKRFYRDFSQVDFDGSHGIYELAQIIRQNGNGITTREAISRSIELLNNQIPKVRYMTQMEYDGLAVIEPNVIYLITR